MDTISAVIASSEIAKASAAFANICSSIRHHLFCLMTYGTDKQKLTYMPKMATGELLGSFAFTESGSGSDAVGMQTTASLEGDTYVLNGRKMWITMENVAHFKGRRLGCSS